MALLVLEKIKKSYSGIPVLVEADFSLNPGEKVGLVGCNGSGKTTLLHIAAGLIALDDGRRSVTGRPAFGLLTQTPDFGNASTVMQAATRAQVEINALEKKLADISETLEQVDRDSAEQDRLIKRQADIEERYRLIGGYARQGKVEAVLNGVGFKGEDYLKDPGMLSGGETKRLQLAMILLGGFDILFLDEPGNHLDISGTEWLTDFLRDYKGSVLLVSHDRYLLNGVARRIVELDEGRTRNYRGDYDYFLTERRRRVEESAKKQGELDRTRARGEEYIRRNFYGQKARQAKSKRKQLDRLETLDIVRSHKGARFRFREAASTGDLVLRFDTLAASFPEKVLFENLTLDLEMGEILGVIGPNGSGKSTLLKTILGRIPPSRGSVWISPLAKIVYFDQQLEGLGTDGTLLDAMHSVMPLATEGELRSHMARFLFRGEEVIKPLQSLSGGERSRALLAKAALTSANLLIMDEPTNHLDIYAREALEEALDHFSGSAVIVSHDRRLLDGVVDKLLVLGAARPIEHIGSYTSYAERLKAEKMHSVSPGSGGTREKTSSRKHKAARDRIKRRHTYEELEALIISKEERLEEINVEIYEEEVYMDHVLSRKLEDEASLLRRELHDLYEEWNTWA